MNTTYLSLGTNLGDKLLHLKTAILKLNKLGTITQISSVYQTPPWGFESDDFYNIALCLETKINSSTLIDLLLTIEDELGRERNNLQKGYVARPLDIDIIFFNQEIINSSKLTVPHPRMQDRKFVLIPLIEIVDNYQHPTLKKSLETLLIETEDTSEILRIKHIQL